MVDPRLPFLPVVCQDLSSVLDPSQGGVAIERVTPSSKESVV